jgi:environmental stress-induced protein Ves
MPSEGLFNLTGIPASPWKNGLGLTRELHIEPSASGAESAVWRVSIAEVDADVAFSLYPGMTRNIVLLKGAGMHLIFADGQAQTLSEAYKPFEFDGEHALEAQLIAGPTQGFNLMVNSAAASGEVIVHRGTGLQALASNTVLLFVASGEASLVQRGDTRQRLAPGDGLRLGHGEAGATLHYNRDAAVLAVHIDKKPHDFG